MANDDQPVGYGRPPVANRFKPGQSGNPSGRRKATASFFGDALEVFSEPVPTLVGARPVNVSMARTMFRRLAKKAISGDTQSMKHIIELMFLADAKVQGDGADQEASIEDTLQRTAKLFKLDPEALRVPPRHGSRNFEAELDPRFKKREAELRAQYSKKGRL